MASKFKNSWGKRFAGLVLAFSLVATIAYSPLSAPRAQAFLGIGDITVLVGNIPDYIKEILAGIGKAIAHRMVDDMVRSTIQWANTGFEGNPAYVTDTGRYFEDIANNAVGDYVSKNNKLNFLCSPFQAQIKLSLVKQNTQSFNPQCTLEDIGVNVENFYNNFADGDWNAWFKVTQEYANNPYAGYLHAKFDLDSRLANSLSLKQEDLTRNSGFLGHSDCIRRNVYPPQSIIDAVQNGEMSQAEARQLYPLWDLDKEAGACLEYGPVKTPGTVIAAQLNNALGSGLQGLISADDIDSLVSAFASGLLQRYVFGPKGLFADSSSRTSSSPESIDIDGDGVPDGQDYDGDGQLDICHHGRKNDQEDPSNTNCIGSKGVTNSPYFVPLCTTLSSTITTFENYLDFATSTEWHNGDYARTWFNETVKASTAIDNLANTLSRYEVRAYDKTIGYLGKENEFLDAVTNSLAKDGDMRNDKGLSGGPDNIADEQTRQTIIRGTRQMLDYLREFEQAIGSCSNPNTAAVENLGTPDTNLGGGGDSGGTGTLSCSSSLTTASVNTPVVWQAQSTYPTGTQYSWIGTNITGDNSATTTSLGSLTITYTTTGQKTAAVGIGTPQGDFTLMQCGQVIVF